MSLLVLATGPLSLIEDAGRCGYAHLGVSMSGAADRGSAQQANLAVGNPADAAVIETLAGGLQLRAKSPSLVAIGGAPTVAEVAGQAVPRLRPFPLKAGQELRLGTSASGLRCYVAVAGGIAVSPVLGSRSYDTMSRLGPPPLQPGQVLPVGPDYGTPQQVTDAWPAAAPETLELVMWPGPRRDWIAADITKLAWRVSAAASRIGTRLDGPSLAWAASHLGRELASEPTRRGAIQVPPSGQPIIFGPDHPATGGYPVVGILSESASDALAQALPGQAIRLRPLS
ncbi:MAG: allophanate hydrolase [Arachnia propionica]|nr:MAG: allophanate hydrolase [Arachnia propionica]